MVLGCKSNLVVCCCFLCQTPLDVKVCLGMKTLENGGALYGHLFVSWLSRPCFCWHLCVGEVKYRLGGVLRIVCSLVVFSLFYSFI